MGKSLADMSDGELNERRFAAMQRLCDTKGIDYPSSLVRYLNRTGKKKLYIERESSDQERTAEKEN